MEMRKRLKRMSCLSTFFVSVLAAAVSVAESSNVWDGPYLGPQIGHVDNTGCSRWTVPGAAPDVAGQLISQECGSGSVVGGVRVGDNFQYGPVFWGLAADVDFSTGKKSNESLVSKGTSPPAGTYFTSARLNPDGFLIVAPRIGYAGREWAPYVRAGGLVALGGRASSIAYTPVAGKYPTASFDGEKSFDTIGWVAGGGIEWGLNGPWSIGVEYLHTSLGKGSRESASCAGTAAACEGFSGLAFENSQNAFTANIFNIAVNYYFDYW